MDIVAKHMPADKDGVRIAELDEMSYREKLWCHRPLTDFWRVGRGIARKLESNGLYTMGDVARCSEGSESSYYNEDFLYKLFGVNAELLIDHAWGCEPTEIADCKAYKPETKSLSQGQVLSRPYTFTEGRIIVREMADQLSMDLVRQGLFTDQVVLDVGYDIENLKDPKIASWILDHIEVGDVFPLLPKDDELLDDYYDLDVWDPQYSDELLASVQYVLANRNGEPEVTKSRLKKVLTDVPTAANQQHVDTPNRKAFDSIISMIPQKDIDHAVKAFEDLFRK